MLEGLRMKIPPSKINAARLIPADSVRSSVRQVRRGGRCRRTQAKRSM